MLLGLDLQLLSGQDGVFEDILVLQGGVLFEGTIFVAVEVGQVGTARVL